MIAVAGVSGTPVVTAMTCRVGNVRQPASSCHDYPGALRTAARSD